MSGSNCCFLTSIQVSQEAGKVVWYSHLSKIFPQFVVIHTVNCFGVVNYAEVDGFLELSCFFDDPADVGNLIAVTDGTEARPRGAIPLLRSGAAAERSPRFGAVA